jgi:hypothetical protein
MNYAFRLLFFLLLCSGCNSEATLTFSSEIFTEKSLDICQNEFCSPVTIDYIIASGDKALSEKINSEIESYIIEALFLGDDSKPSAQNIPEAATDFILAYRDHQPDIPSELDTGGYEAEISVVDRFQNDQWVCIQFTKYLYEGGVHAFESTLFQNFNLETALLMDYEALFDDLSGFKSLAEDTFRKNQNISADGPLNEAGFWFENETFELPESIGFSEANVILVYNSFEISPYGTGALELEIPMSEVAPYLKANLL